MKIFLFLVLVFTSYSFACMTGVQKSISAKEVQKRFKVKKRTPAGTDLPFAEGHTSPSLEAKLGNLLLSFKNGGTKGILSLPVHMEQSDYHPFGDGQSNAKMDLGSWNRTEFPVVGIQTQRKNIIKREYKFHESLQITKYKETDLGQGQYKVQPEGWRDVFYFSFETGTLPVSEFVAGIAVSNRSFSKERVAPNISKIAKGEGMLRISGDLGPGFNRDAWFNDNVHGRFPNESGNKTAIGGVFTKGVVDRAFGPFKYLYTCFEPRDTKAEKINGAPSGSGWHHIGDAAETVLNTLENNSIPVAIARSHHQPNSAYGLTENIVANWLDSDWAFVTRQGEFHWYLNPYEAPVCAEIWVHNCLPSASNNWGFKC